MSLIYRDGWNERLVLKIQRLIFVTNTNEQLENISNFFKQMLMYVNSFFLENINVIFKG
jgi:hypothetical protein